MAETLVTAFVTLFVTVDPLGVAPLFASLTAALSAPERRHVATRGVLIGGAVLFAFAFVGIPLLDALGIGLPAFRIAGGVLLLLLSIDMVMARQSGLRATTPVEEAESGNRADISVFPLAIPLIAGPGALTSVVLYMGQARGDLLLQAGVIGVLLIVLVLTLACLWITARLMHLLGVTGINVVTRVFGILLAALAVQFIVDGVLAVWPGHAGG